MFSSYSLPNLLLARLFRGAMDLLGSIGPRFVGENKTDIHLTNWRVNDELQPRRQRGTTIAPGLTFITTESSALSAAQLLAPGGPPADAWKYDVKWLATLEFTLLGPSVPNVLRVPMVRFYFY